MIDEKNILQEIENESNVLLEELNLLSEEKNENKPIESIQDDNKKDVLKKKIVNKGNEILKHMQKRVSDEEYIVNGYGYHSKTLYKMSTKFPFLGKTIGMPLMAITRTVTNNAISRKMEQEKALKVYTTLKGDKAAVDAQIAILEKLQKPKKEQKEQLILLKKMSAELEFNLKRVEYNFKMSHIEAARSKNSFSSGRKIYKM